jgi:hypothetical protein
MPTDLATVRKPFAAMGLDLGPSLGACLRCRQYIALSDAEDLYAAYAACGCVGMVAAEQVGHGRRSSKKPGCNFSASSAPPMRR